MMVSVMVSGIIVFIIGGIVFNNYRYRPHEWQYQAISLFFNQNRPRNNNIIGATVAMITGGGLVIFGVMMLGWK